MKKIKSLIKSIAQNISIKLLRAAFPNERVVPRGYVYERAIEYSFAFEVLMEYKKKNILDVGSGKSAFPALLVNCGFNVTAIDKVRDYYKGIKGEINYHFKVINDDICNLSREYDLFDAITCISVLEHIDNPTLAVKNMASLLKPGGILILTFPFTTYEYIPNVYDLPDSDELSSRFQYKAQSFTEENLAEWEKQFGIKEIKRVYIRGWNGRYWRCGNRIAFPHATNNPKEANAVCLAYKSGF